MTDWSEPYVRAKVAMKAIEQKLALGIDARAELQALLNAVLDLHDALGIEP